MSVYIKKQALFEQIVDGLDKIVIPTLPPSTQHIYGNKRGGGKYLKPQAVSYKHEVYYEAKRQYKGEPMDGEVFIAIAFYFPDKKVRDIDNYKKVLLDALKGVLWHDDRQIDFDITIKSLDKENPRLEFYFAPMVCAVCGGKSGEHRKIAGKTYKGKKCPLA